VSGEFNAETREAVKVFQISEGIVASADASGAGNFGSKTQTALKSKIENFNSTVTKERNRTEMKIYLGSSADWAKKSAGGIGL